MRADLRIDGSQTARIELAALRRDFPREVISRGTFILADRTANLAAQTTLFNDRTGNLRRSIGVQQSRDVRGRFSVGWSAVAGGAQAFYARFLLLGTRFISPRPFLQNAAAIVFRTADSVFTTLAARFSRR